MLVGEIDREATGEEGVLEAVKEGFAFRDRQGDAGETKNEKEDLLEEGMRDKNWFSVPEHAGPNGTEEKLHIPGFFLCANHSIATELEPRRHGPSC